VNTDSLYAPMDLPIRCFHCGYAYLQQQYYRYYKWRQKGYSVTEAFRKIGFLNEQRECCRQLIISMVPLREMTLLLSQIQ
jgi:DNA-directed RNA polymerase subunit N (RpoN/RPB10)